MPDIRHSLLIAASPSEVYNALTTSQGLSAWWTPDVVAKAEVGSIAHFPFGAEYFKEMKITALEQNRFVNWHCIAGGEEWIGTEISFILTATYRDNLQKLHYEMNGQLEQLKGIDEITLLQFQHNNWKEDSPMFAECSYTWALFLRSLKLYCETGEGTPWPAQHVVAG